MSDLPVEDELSDEQWARLAPSMSASPNSFTTTAVSLDPGWDIRQLRRVVFPAPRNPVIMVTGMRSMFYFLYGGAEFSLLSRGGLLMCV